MLAPIAPTSSEPHGEEPPLEISTDAAEPLIFLVFPASLPRSSGVDVPGLFAKPRRWHRCSGSFPGQASSWWSSGPRA